MTRNENYCYNPVSEQKYFISETEYMDIVKAADYGYLLKDHNGNYFYAPGETLQSYVYQDYESYQTGNGICYINQYEFENTENFIIPANEIMAYSRDDFYAAVRYSLLTEYNDYFKNDIIPTKLLSNITDFVFENVDWQTPEAFLDEINWEEDIKEYYKNIGTNCKQEYFGEGDKIGI